MQKRSDETLIAYLDGELDATERSHVEAWLRADPSIEDRLTILAASAALVRTAFDEVLNEPVPDRLIAAARGETIAAGTTIEAEEAMAEVVVLNQRSTKPRRILVTRQWLGVPLAASLAALMVGGGLGYYGVGWLGTDVPAGKERAIEVAASNNSWLDNAAGNYKLLIGATDNGLIDIPATGDTQAALQKISQSLPQQVRLPDLKPWGVNFRGARLVVIEGRPAAQLVYATDNKSIGPLTLTIGSSKQADMQPTFDKRQDINLLYWRHQGRAYVLAGRADIGYLWGIANDVAWQLDAI